MSTRSMRLELLIALMLAALTGACGSTNRSAPVFDRAPAPVVTTPVESRTDSTREQKPAVGQVTTASTAAKPQTSKPSNTVATAPEKAPSKQTGKQQTAARPATVERDQPTERGDWRPDSYTVRKGDTLYSIALDFGHDYRDLAAWNNLPDAAYIQIGQRLRLSPPDSGNAISATAPTAALPAAGNRRPPSVSVPTFADPKAYRSDYSDQALTDVQRLLAGEVETAVVATAPAKPQAAPTPAASTPAPRTPSPAPKPAEPPAAASAADERLKWEWPASGALLYSFAEGPIKKGVGITGQAGQAVVSSAPGKVVYSGSGLRGYGNLIIVKHNATYLSVYAHNQQLLVSEGQMVAQGQKIAVMGEISSGRIGLHFEIRRLGKPMDPLKYLPDRSS